MRKILKRLSQMCGPAHSVLRGGLIISCALLAGSIAIIVSAGPYSIHTYMMYNYSNTFMSLAFPVMLIAVVGSALIEEQHCKKN